MGRHAETIERSTKAFRHAGGTLRLAEAVRRGISRSTLQAMLDAGLLERVSRGVYRLTELPPLANPDLAIVALRVPEGVVCLISALTFHDLTTQRPHRVQIALPRGWKAPRIDHPPVEVFRFSKASFESGVMRHDQDGICVRIYSPEKTLADCFKYRNRIGLDVAIEALRLWRRRRGARVDELLRQAKVCRVERVIRPYLEATL